tara:strand:+ start:1601 stop:1759 length:159 start_codon:yes stop_codon:yes gene_type:complete
MIFFNIFFMHKIFKTNWGRSVTRPLLNILHFTTLFQKLLADFLTFGQLLNDF